MVAALLAVLATAGLAAVPLFAFLDAPFANGDEAIYAGFLAAMRRTGDLTALRWGDAVVAQKPWAPFAACALVSRVVSGEAGARLLPVVITALTGFATGLAAARVSGRTPAGVVAVLVTAAAPGWGLYGGRVSSDPPFVFGVILALVAAMAALARPRALVGVGVGLGIALASKSLAALVPAVALLPALAVILRRHGSAARRPALVGLLCLLVLGLPFYVHGVWRFGRYFLSDHFGWSLGARARGELPGVGLGGPDAYLRHLAVGEGPVFLAALVLVVGAALVVGFRARARAGADRDARIAAERLLVPAVFGVLFVVLLSALGTRLPHYLLPLYPSFGLAAGVLAGRAAQWVAQRGASRLLHGVPALAAFALFVVGLGRPLDDAFALPAAPLAALGRAANPFLAPDEPIHALDLYVPVVAVYAERPWRLLATSTRLAEVVSDVDVFAQDHTVVTGPPWSPGRRWVVAVSPEALVQAGLPVRRAVAEAGGFVLYEVGE